MSATQRGSKHDNMMNERRKQPNAGQKKEEHIGRFKSFLNRGINTVTYTIVTVHTICERALFSYLHVYCNLVPSTSFRYKRKAKKRPWNTSNT